MARAKPIPDGYHSVTPYLIVDDGPRAIEFYREAFGAEEILRVDAPGGKIGHAEVRIGDSILMLASEYPEMGFKGPRTYGGSPVSLLVYVEDVDAIAARAEAAGAKVLKPLQDQFYGDRSATYEDPFGHVWTVATHVEDLTPEEINRRAAEAMGG